MIEAFCRGRPVVGAVAGGIPDIVENGVSGRLVPPEDPEALADALVGCLEDRALVERLGADARSSVRPWLQTPEQFAERMLELVERAVAA